MAMSIKYYVLPEERAQMQEGAVKRAMISIQGPVGFYERWPGEGPRLTITDEALEVWRPFCKLVWEDETRKELCCLDYEERAANCTKPEVGVCIFGVHNAVCPVKDEHGGSVTLIGGEFRVRERKAEAEELLEQFLGDIPPQQRETFREAWSHIPEVTEEEVFSRIMRELELGGRGYLHALKQRSDFRYKADLATHDVVIALQALIGEVEVLKIELKDAFGIGKKWERRFESLIRICEEHHEYLETRLELDKPKYAYEPINELISECVDSYLPKAKARWIQFQVDQERGVDEEGKHKVLTVRMDRTSIRQALLNVLDNAVKYSFDGTADHPRWIEVVGRLRKEQGVQGYIIAVSNLGIGVEEDELELVFEPGYQGRRRLDEDRSGYGMGLTFVKECVERHGGGVAIRSQPQRRTGSLTTLYIWLPIHGPTGRHSRRV
jgi:signal transduction histidine kinase